MPNSAHNILFLSNSAGNHTGSPKALLDLAGNLDKGCYIPLLALPDPGPLAEEFKASCGEVHFCKSASLSKSNVFFFWQKVREFIAFYKHHKVALVHFNWPGWRESAVLAAVWLNIPFIIHIHNACGKKEFKKNFNFAWAKKIVIVSESMRPSFLESPKLLQKMVCIHNGVDLERFAPHSRQDPAEMLPVSPGSPVIGYVGQLSHRKGVDVLIQAAPAVLSKHPEALFVIAGAEGIQEEGYAKSLKKLARELGVLDRFLFMGKREDIPQVMNACDLVVVPSRAEPFGKVVIEAMACGKCVIASAVGGIPEIVADNVYGLLVRPESVEDLQQAMQRALQDPCLRSRLAADGRRHVQAQFCIKSVAEKTQNLYAQLLQVAGA